MIRFDIGGFETELGLAKPSRLWTGRVPHPKEAKLIRDQARPREAELGFDLPKISINQFSATDNHYQDTI